MTAQRRTVVSGYTAVLVTLLAAVLVLAACGTGAKQTTTGHHPAAAATEPTFPLRAGERMLSVQMTRPYRPAAPHGGTDDYRCFLLDPHLTQRAFLTGVGFMPGNPDVVHHAILFQVPAAQVKAAETKDAQTPGDGWTCFGGTGIPAPPGSADSTGNGGWLDAWAPGGEPVTYADGLGIPVDAGSRVVLQVHYNLLAGDQPDQTGVRLRLTPATAKITPLETVLFAAPVELPCTAAEHGPLCNRDAAVKDVVSRFGAENARTITGLQQYCGGDPKHPRAGATQHCDQRAPFAMTVRAAAGHMHLLGRSVTVTVNPGTPQERVIVDVPQYDFDHQGLRPLAQPVQIHKGDTVRVTCTHDAKLRSMLPALQKLPPRYVVWGEGTSDEMCLGILSVTRP
jgi:hypothetical protein